MSAKTANRPMPWNNSLRGEVEGGMSSPLAIAAVTATLRNLLTTSIASDPELNEPHVTMQPLDRARPAGNNANQLNIFLYWSLPNAAWRNRPVPCAVSGLAIA